jgi:hypothetical protein
MMASSIRHSLPTWIAPTHRVTAPFTVVTVFVAVLGCSDTSAPFGPVITDVNVIAHGPLSRTAMIELDGPGAVIVRYGAGARTQLVVTSSQPSTHHEVLLPRLLADTRYEFEVESNESMIAGTFDTGSLPADLAAITFDVEGEPSHPLTMLEFARQDGADAFKGVVIVDGDGNVVWYFRSDRAVTGTTRRTNGNFVFLDVDRGLLEVTPAGEVLRTLPQEPAGRTMHHDVIATPTGTLLVLRLDRQIANDTLVAGEAIWEWNPDNGTEQKLWSSFDVMSPATDRGPRYNPGDWLHANSLFLGERGHILVSLHHLNQVISIAPDRESLEWRLGGTNATIAAPAGDPFSGQHTAAETGPDRVIIFDNGLERAEAYSRAIEMAVNSQQATKLWEFRPPHDNWSRAISSARRLDNGNTLVAFGMGPGVGGSTGPIEVYDVDPAGAIAWHLIVRGNVQLMYRATVLNTIGGEQPVTR